MLIKQVPVADLKEYGQNSRTHSTLQVGQIAESIKAFGWTNPLLVDEARVLIAGHGRLAAAKLPCSSKIVARMFEPRAIFGWSGPSAVSLIRSARS